MYLYEYQLRGTESAIITLSQRLDVALRDLRPWYLWLSRTNAIGVAFTITFATDVLRDALLMGREQSVAEVLPVALTAIVIIGTTLFLVLLPLNRLVFPYGYFRLGGYEERFRHLDYVRWTVIPGTISLLLWLWQFL